MLTLITRTMTAVDFQTERKCPMFDRALCVVRIWVVQYLMPTIVMKRALLHCTLIIFSHSRNPITYSLQSHHTQMFNFISFDRSSSKSEITSNPHRGDIQKTEMLTSGQEKECTVLTHDTARRELDSSFQCHCLCRC